jgi:stage IV sporulation protein B
VEGNVFFMERIKWMRKQAWKLWMAAMAGYLCFAYVLLMQSIPDEMYLFAGETQSMALRLPVTASLEVDDRQMEVSCFSNGTKMQEEVSLSDSVSLLSEQTGTFSMRCRLFGIITLKDVEVTVIEREDLYVSGQTVGIYMETDGVLVVGIGEVTGADGLIHDPVKNILKVGDYITAIDGKSIDSKETLVKQLQQTDGEEVILEVVRDGQTLSVRVEPVMTKSGSWRLGMWVRDDLAGVGTMTFVTSDGVFGALGHPVSDIDTSVQICFSQASLFDAHVSGITKGTVSETGRLSGVIDYVSGSLGEIDTNSEVGIFGRIASDRLSDYTGEKTEIALKQEITLDTAYILTDIGDGPTLYEVTINGVDFDAKQRNKGILLEVTDERLLDKTGGIVQGMSGSPIIQNGKLIGAVTHVFVNDPTKGYGVFIEEMLEE